VRKFCSLPAALSASGGHGLAAGFRSGSGLAELVEETENRVGSAVRRLFVGKVSAFFEHDRPGGPDNSRRRPPVARPHDDETRVLEMPSTRDQPVVIGRGGHGPQRFRNAGFKKRPPVTVYDLVRHHGRVVPSAP